MRADHISAQRSACPAAGIVFLVCIILFQHLHYLDTAGALQRAFSYTPPSSSGAAMPLLYCVAVNEGNALLCELQGHGFAPCLPVSGSRQRASQLGLGLHTATCETSRLTSPPSLQGP